MHTEIRLSEDQKKLPEVDADSIINFDEYASSTQVRSEFATYQAQSWSPWAEREKSVRETISLYSKLFTLKQQLVDGIVEKALELAWGVGIGVWDNKGAKVIYPLVTRLVELSLNETTGAIEIRPRDVQPRLELDWYAATDNQGVAAVEKASKDFFLKATQTLSPFDRGTFEPLLRSAATHLDPNGAYRPDQISPEDRDVPKPQSNLVVTDSWVIFARPRSTSIFVQDLERFKEQLSSDVDTELPKAVLAVVTDPDTSNDEVQLPEFRGVSMSGSSAETTGTNDSVASKGKPKDLFFPKPFNDEQVRIVQLLEVSDGVVVQGPPGTGKTHTIANVICHYLATGKRVLVTSMKDPALAVLRDQLPDDIRPLAISLLSTESDGMKQFEHAIHKIASEVQSIDRTATARQIETLEASIDALHGQIARLDYEVGRWAKANIDPIDLDGERIDPQDAARGVVDGAGNFDWLTDKLGVSPEFAPRITNEDIVNLRKARRVLGRDISYLSAALPSHASFPDSRLLLQVHQDLAQYEKLKDKVELGDVPALIDSSQEALTEAATLLTEIDRLEAKRSEIVNARRPWVVKVRNQIVEGKNSDLFQMLSTLGKELEQEKDVQLDFYKRPVDLPAGLETDSELLVAVEKLAKNESPFGLLGLIGKSAQKQALRNIRVLEKADIKDVEDWSHISNFLGHRQRLRQLAVRWNALALETGLEALPSAEPEHGIAALQQFQLVKIISSVVAAEKSIASKSSKIFPSFDAARRVPTDPRAAQILADALRHHLTKNRLSNVWATKEKFQAVLQGKTGEIVLALRRFLAETLGSPKIEDAQMQAEWTALMAELARVQGLSNDLAIVADVTNRMAENGAPIWAEQCRLPQIAPIDPLLPDDWRVSWRLRRLTTHLDEIDGQRALKKLANDRAHVAHDLATAYENTVSKRTWLKLAEKASPSIRAALAAYLTAIQKIGKGTGKRAVRYRRDARSAASAANPAVPCWIMPHHRISESLPPEFGCFDLVIIDEASQSDLAALPALLRAQKVLIVGDDKQVSPEGVGLEEEKVRHLMSRYLQDQVAIYRPQLSPERSLYDLFKVVFARSAVMLREHFRCVPAIIEYSKREFYNHELRPLRIPLSSERIDPPLVDVLVEDGFRDGDINRPEADFILQEIQKLVEDERMQRRSIGVVSLLADKQAMFIWEKLTDSLGPELMRRHHIACGDARTFQGKERDVMFLSMVSAPNDRGAALSRDTFAQRFNVAASRARDRMYLVRSIEPDQLSDKDLLRRGLIAHFSKPFLQDEQTISDLRERCESPFEREMYDELTRRGYRVMPQVKVGSYRIDMVVEGVNDERLAIECDGDRYHGADKWADDMQRQRILERAGWVFWRCFASAFVRHRDAVLADLLAVLRDRGIEQAAGENVPISLHAETRRVRVSELIPPRNSATENPSANSDEEPSNSTHLASSPSSLRVAIDSAVSRNQTSRNVTGTANSPNQSAATPPRASASPSSTAYSEELLRSFLGENSLTSEDHRNNKGALWVHLDDVGSDAARRLAAWGFNFKKGRGWWRK